MALLRKTSFIFALLLPGALAIADDVEAPAAHDNMKDQVCDGLDAAPHVPQEAQGMNLLQTGLVLGTVEAGQDERHEAGSGLRAKLEQMSSAKLRQLREVAGRLLKGRTETAPVVVAPAQSIQTVPQPVVQPIAQVVGVPQVSHEDDSNLNEILDNLDLDNLDLDNLDLDNLNALMNEENNNAAEENNNAGEENNHAVEGEGHFKRVWFVCEGPPVKPETEDEKFVGVKTARKVNCTEEMHFEEMCCTNWQDKVFPVDGAMALSGDESPDAMKDMVSTYPNIYTLCTESTPKMGVAEYEHAFPSQFGTECLPDEFTPAQLQGTEGGMAPGEIFLRKRIEYLVAQGMPVHRIPTCREEVKACDNGRAPTTVDKTWLDELKKEEDESPQVLLSQKAEARTEQFDGKRSSPRLHLTQRAETRAKQFGGAFGGALLTSGSFTMMAASGGF